MQNAQQPSSSLEQQLSDIRETLSVQQKILEKMQSRSQLQAIFFWIRAASFGLVLVTGVIGALLYARVLNEVSSQIEAIGR